MPAEPSRAGQKHNILVAVSGQTPAIITETLWALQRKRETEVDQVRVITTSKGRESIIRTLLGDSGKFTSFCRDYHIAPGRIAFSEKDIYVLRGPRGEELEDIRDTKENAAAADQVFSLIREWARREDEVLFCSAAGGRKTLGIYLAMSLMLCGRLCDSLSHVLAAPAFETGVPGFFYPPPAPCAFERIAGARPDGSPILQPVSSEEASVELADIPFPRLRELIGGELPLEKGLISAVESSQLLLTYLQAPPLLTVNLHKSNVEVGHFTFPLSRQLLAVYAFMLITVSASPSGLSLENLFVRKNVIADLERRIDSYKAGEKEEYAWEKICGMADFRDRIRPCVSKINHAIYSAVGRNRFAEHLTIHAGRDIKVRVANFKIIVAEGKRWKGAG